MGSEKLNGNWLGSINGNCDNPLSVLLGKRSVMSLLLWLLTLLPLATTALLPRPTGVGGVSLRLTSMGVGEWAAGLTCPLVFKVVIMSS